MYRHTLKHVAVAALLLVALVLAAGCKPSIPGRYLQPDKMADILYDYHLAQGITSTAYGGDSLAMRAFKANILSKHGVSEAEFDSSMVYYTRHTQLLDNVYKSLTDRFNNETMAQGGSAASLDGALGGDTTDVWRSAPAFVLAPYAATNRNSFAIEADSAYHAGDCIILDFDAQYLYQDGMRDAVMVLAVTYDNDSTEFTTNNIMSSSHYHMTINNSGRLRIKRISGFWLLNSELSGGPTTTIRLLIVSNVRLIRMHVKEEPPAEPASGGTPADSAATPPNGPQPPDTSRILRPGQLKGPAPR